MTSTFNYRKRQPKRQHHDDVSGDMHDLNGRPRQPSHNGKHRTASPTLEADPNAPEAPHRGTPAKPHGANGTGAKQASKRTTKPATTGPILPEMVQTATVVDADVDDNNQTHTASRARSSPVDDVTNHPFWLHTNDSPRVIGVPHWILDVVSEGNEILVSAQLIAGSDSRPKEKGWALPNSSTATFGRQRCCSTLETRFGATNDKSRHDRHANLITGY